MTYHLLNGDALKSQFPRSLSGEQIVARECLVDGDIKGDTLAAFFANRASFISQTYPGYQENDYFEKTVLEFKKIQKIPKGAEVNLWFEDDLFCQVNCWFCIYLLKIYDIRATLFLVRPNGSLAYGFGGMSEDDLIEAYQNRTAIPVADFEPLSQLWRFYQQDQLTEMLVIGRALQARYPFLLPAMQAHMERMPREGSLGRPKEALIAIMEELQTSEFAPIFRAFSQRESIYGFGDLQVKRLLDEI
ncbi:MAG: hypothetical protein R2828_09965 [Saprospiraceae bacterium]